MFSENTMLFYGHQFNLIEEENIFLDDGCNSFSPRLHANLVAPTKISMRQIIKHLLNSEERKQLFKYFQFRKYINEAIKIFNK